MEKLTKCVGLLLLAYVLCGFGYKQYQEYNSHYEVKSFTETVRSNDTLWGICEQYYNADNERVCFEEFVYNQKQLNKRLLENGRALQPGDKLTLVCKVRVANVK